MTRQSNALKKKYLFLSAAATLLYWYWESIASGNIRVDLLIIYPVLYTMYTVTLWNKFRWYSLFISAILMGINIVVMIISYSLFGKNPG